MDDNGQGVKSQAALDTVRRILFGSELDEVLARFERVENSLEEQVATLRQELAKRAKQIDESGKSRDDALGERVGEVLSRVDALREESTSARDDLERAIRDRIDHAISDTVADTEVALGGKVGRKDLAAALIALAGQITGDAKRLIDEEVTT